MSNTLTFRLLGGLTISRAGDPLSGFHSRKEQALLCYLAVTGRGYRRPLLAGLFWGDLPERRALANLRRALSHLRGVAGEHLVITRETAAFDPDSDYWLDVEAFEASVAGLSDASTHQKGDLADLREGIELYRGDFLVGFYLRGCARFEEWVLGEQERLRTMAVEGLRALVRMHRERGEYRAAIGYARRLLRLDPWREEAHRELMGLLALSGQRDAALAQYRACCRVLEAELGLEPLEETQALYRRLVHWGGDDARTGWSPSSRHAPRVLPFTGRAEEHAELVRWRRTAQRDTGRLALLEGEAGVGKTRLVEEVARHAEAEGAIVLRGRCYQFAADVPYQPIAQALRGWLRPEGVPESGRAAHGHQLSSAWSDASPLEGLAPVWLSELSRLLPELRQAVTELPSPRVPGEASRQRLFEAVARLLSGHSAELLLLCLDDLQWADRSTLDLVHYLVRRLAELPVWMIGAYRPEEVSLSHGLARLRHGLGRDGMLDRMTLKPLPHEAVEEIVWSLLGDDEARLVLANYLYRESEGNPFVLSELIGSMEEDGTLRRDDEGRWVWRGATPVGRLPGPVRDLVLQRVGRLNEESQGLLCLAAVVGGVFDRSLLETATTADARTVRDAIQEWLSRGLVRSREGISRLVLDAAVQYDFSHDRIRVAVYEAIGPLRPTLHRRVAEALEQRQRGDSYEHAALLGQHWDRASDPGRAATWYLRAGDQARMVYAGREAVAYYEKALPALREREDYERAARTLMKLGMTYHNAFDFPQARRAYDEGLALWQRAGGGRRAAPRHGRHALRLRWAEPASLDPALVADGDSRCIVSHLFSGLVALTPELDVVPDVARGWEVSEGGRRLVFHLRDDVVWSDGKPVTAGDFEYAWKRVLDPVTGSPAARFLHDLKGARAVSRGKSEVQDVGVHAPDDLTLAVELEHAVGYFLQLLTHSSCRPVPRHVVEAEGREWTETAFLSNGPFQLEAWQRGARLALCRNPAYHGRFGGNVGRVELHVLPEWSDRLERYACSSLDVLGITYFPAGQRETIRQRFAAEYVSGPRLETCYLVFDLSRPPFQDVRIRRALALATDRETLADRVLQGYVSPASGGFVPPGMPGHVPGIGLPYDPEQARRLLSQAGYEAGRGFPAVEAIIFDAGASRGEYLAAQWREVLGVETDWKALPWSEFLERISRDRPPILGLMWVADYPDPDNFLRVCRGQTWDGWRNPEYDRLVDEARRTTDQEERLRLHCRAEQVLREDMPILPLSYERQHLLVRTRVRRYPTSAMQPAFWKDVLIG